MYANPSISIALIFIKSNINYNRPCSRKSPEASPTPSGRPRSDESNKSSSTVNAIPSLLSFSPRKRLNRNKNLRFLRFSRTLQYPLLTNEMAEDYTSAAVDDPTSSSSAGDPPKNSGTAAKSKQRIGVVARIWKGIFGGGSDDYEKRLSYLSKEEASVHARMKRRALRSRRTARNIIVLSFFVEVIAVTYAIMTTRSLDLEWKMRALRVLPMFALPVISILVYSALTNLTRMCNYPTLKHCIKFPS
ncbi:Uncharacterized protein MA16_Dca019911 [Dendrobium catenatum]|uniref:Uncharacterized protein n=1 Tax=Dendrobium catenatum TaxID=906689 RepID=A0A2I0XEM5_9ASPA|nr:Uncharacterized protein MA16_Dca019911 [Dendrobium catenatum]